LARNKAFNEADILRKVLFLFWEKGYEHTSFEDILAFTGLRKSSLYNTFGNKNDLFVRTFNLYRQLVGHKIVSKKQGKDFLVNFFIEILRDEKDMNLPSGCLICNSIFEFRSLPGNDPKKLLAYNSWRIVEQSILNALVFERDKGSLKENTDVEFESRWLISQIFALRSFARLNKFGQKLFL
jgi:TetR/AcrR family transcriptional repressor of nem operon